jgi:uncharacterized protein (DUF58 family)
LIFVAVRASSWLQLATVNVENGFMRYKINVMLNREGWFYVGMLSFIIAGAIIRDINLLYVMAGMMLGPLVLSLIVSIRNLRRLRFSRRFPRLVSAGDPLIVELLVEKTGGHVGSFAVTAEERIHREHSAGSGPSESVRLFYSRIPANSAAEACYRIRLHERGQYRFDPVRVSTSMPIGLVRAFMRQGTAEHVLVSPRPGRLLPAWSRRLRIVKEGGQKSMRRRGKAEGDFYGMREWRDGDSKNWIHWRTSAKRNKLAVRQSEQRISQDLVIVLDLWQRGAECESSRAVELAVSFVATLVLDHGRRGSSHMVVASASQHRFLLRGTTSSVFRQEVMERLAMVQPTRHEQLPDVLADVLPFASSNSKVIVVSNRTLDLGDAQAFSKVWQHNHLRRGFGDVLCVNTTSPEFESLFATNLVPLATSPDSLPKLQEALAE